VSYVATGIFNIMNVATEKNSQIGAKYIVYSAIHKHKSKRHIHEELGEKLRHT